MDASPADWVSYLLEANPSEEQAAFDVNNPFEADGGKVSILDSDHWWVVPIYGDESLGSQWVWKAFCRGHNPILMEHLPPRSFVASDHPLTSNDPGYIASRRALGHTRRFAERIALAAMSPHNELSCTRYCLAAPGEEYLVYQPTPGEKITVMLEAGQYDAEWFDPQSGIVAAKAHEQVAGGHHTFAPPFTGAAVLYLKKHR